VEEKMLKIEKKPPNVIVLTGIRFGASPMFDIRGFDVCINPDDVIRSPVRTAAEERSPVTRITRTNNVTQLVEGTPENIINLLNNMRSENYPPLFYT
jgi:hypothetical protein